jgi:hypothetical protein
LPVFLFFFFFECEHVVFQHCQKRELQKLMLVVLFKKLRLSIIWNQYLIITLADFHVYLIFLTKCSKLWFQYQKFAVKVVFTGKD